MLTKSFWGVSEEEERRCCGGVLWRQPAADDGAATTKPPPLGFWKAQLPDDGNKFDDSLRKNATSILQRLVWMKALHSLRSDPNAAGQQQQQPRWW